jgi:hypothetical protein
LRLLLDNPGLAGRSCKDCQKFVYLEDGPHKNQKVTRGGLPILRAGDKPNCKACPKESPSRAWKYNLSKPSKRILADYWNGRATSGVFFGNSGICSRTSDMLSICERMTQTHKDASMMKMIVTLLQGASI